MSAEWVDMGTCPAGAPPTSGVNLAGAPDHYLVKRWLRVWGKRLAVPLSA